MAISGLIRKVAVVVSMAAVLLSGVARSYAGALDNMISRGMLRIGVLADGPPMGMIDKNGAPVGYDIDVANLLGKYIGLPVEIVPLTQPSRIPALLTGRIDFLVATLAPTGERARTVMFSQPYNVFYIGIISKGGRKIERLEQLKGRRVAVSRGSTQEIALRNARIAGMQTVLYDDDATSAQSFFSGQVDAVALPSSVTQILRKQFPGVELHSFTFYRQGNSMATRMGDFDVLQWLNTAIYVMKSSGDLDAIARKWTGYPMADLPGL